MRHSLVVLLTLVVAGDVAAAEPADQEIQTPPGTNAHGALRLEPVWRRPELTHYPSAPGICVFDGFLYLGSSGDGAQIAKIRAADGRTLWSMPTQGSHASYPVSNGKVVVFNDAYEPRLVHCVDDATGRQRWQIKEADGLSIAAFAGDLVLTGCPYLSAIDWKSGKLRWQSRRPISWSRPYILGGLALVGSADGFLCAVDVQTGNVVWYVDCDGRAATGPVVAGNWAFIVVDDLKLGKPWENAKQHKHLVVVDLATKKIVARHTAKRQWCPNGLVDGGRVYYYEPERLCAFDAARGTLLWEFTAPEAGPLACPLFQADTILLARNELKLHGEHDTRQIVLDAKTGRVLAESDTGGIGGRWPYYVQSGDVMIETIGLSAHKIVRVPSR